MLPDSIVRHWHQAAAVAERATAIQPEQARQAWNLFHTLTPLPPDEVRSRLADADDDHNRDLSWLLLDAALRLDMEADPGRVLDALEWASFVGEFSGSRRVQAEHLEAHCQFAIGLARHAAADLHEAQTAYARAEAAYQDVAAGPVLIGLAVYAQGATRFERGEVGDESGESGAPERFVAALAVLRSGAPSAVVRDVEAAVDRALAQRRLLDELLAAEDPGTPLSACSELVDRTLGRLVIVRVRELAADGAETASVLRTVELATLVWTRLGGPDPRQWLIDSLWQARRWDVVERLLRDDAARHPGDPEAVKRLAMALLLRGANRREAVALLQGLVRRQPDDAHLHNLLGQALFQLGDQAAARASFERALELDPGNEQARFNADRVRPAAGFHFQDGTLTVEGDITGLPPEQAAAGMVAAMVAGSDRGDELLREVEASDPALAGRVRELLRGHELDDTGAERPAERPAERHLARAERLFGESRWQEAIEEYRLAAEADPNLAGAYVGWGDVHFMLGNYHLARAYFQEALAIQPDPYAYRFLGDTFRRLGKRDQAVEAYRAALELEPCYAGAQQSLRSLLDQGGSG